MMTARPRTRTGDITISVVGPNAFLTTPKLLQFWGLPVVRRASDEVRKLRYFTVDFSTGMHLSA
jgi:hypothetical protein